LSLVASGAKRHILSGAEELATQPKAAVSQSIALQGSTS